MALRPVDAVVTVPSALCAAEWHISVQVLVLWLYAMGSAPFDPTTLASKFTRRSPLIVGEVAPMPCEVWQTEQLNPC